MQTNENEVSVLKLVEYKINVRNPVIYQVHYELEETKSKIKKLYKKRPERKIDL